MSTRVTQAYMERIATAAHWFGEAAKMMEAKRDGLCAALLYAYTPPKAHAAHRLCDSNYTEWHTALLPLLHESELLEHRITTQPTIHLVYR